MSFGIYIKELNVLVLSTRWATMESLTRDFKAVASTFGVMNDSDVLITGQTVKMVVVHDKDDSKNDAVQFGSRWASTEVPIDHVYVWTEHANINVSDGKQLERMMGDSKFVKKF